MESGSTHRWAQKIRGCSRAAWKDGFGARAGLIKPRHHQHILSSRFVQHRPWSLLPQQQKQQPRQKALWQQQQQCLPLPLHQQPRSPRGPLPPLPCRFRRQRRHLPPNLRQRHPLHYHQPRLGHRDPLSHPRPFHNKLWQQHNQRQQRSIQCAFLLCMSLRPRRPRQSYCLLLKNPRLRWL